MLFKLAEKQEFFNLLHTWTLLEPEICCRGMDVYDSDLYFVKTLPRKMVVFSSVAILNFHKLAILQGYLQKRLTQERIVWNIEYYRQYGRDFYCVSLGTTNKKITVSVDPCLALLKSWIFILNNKEAKSCVM